ncbi:MAG: aldose epimerase family protein [Bacteroidota bacterium]
MKKYTYIIAILPFTLLACNQAPEKEPESKVVQENTGLRISKEKYGSTDEGAVELYTLSNKDGMMMKVSTFGGTLTELHVPDRDGNLEDVTLGFDSLSAYQKKHPNFGSLIGRYGNRIAKGKFSIDGQTYTLALNNGENALHGGIRGFNKRIWAAQPIEADHQVGLELRYTSPDMEEGYPGNLSVVVRYLLNNANEWIIEYEATTDKKTPINLTQHAYFNFKGAGNGDILDHELMINANRYTPVDATLIPTGELANVENTPFDFRMPTAIGKRIEEENQQLENGGGYDHNWVLNRDSKGLELAATLYEAESGRFMEVLTTEPGVQFYCGNFLDGSNIGKGNKAYAHRTGLCLETQHFPNSPNQDNFPSTILSPEEKYESKTIYRFSVR